MLGKAMRRLAVVILVASCAAGCSRVERLIGGPAAACDSPRTREGLLRSLEADYGELAAPARRGGWSLGFERIVVDRYDQATKRASCSADVSLQRGQEARPLGRASYAVQPMVDGGERYEFTPQSAERVMVGMYWLTSARARAQVVAPPAIAPSPVEAAVPPPPPPPDEATELPGDGDPAALKEER